jgi:anti-anti-sigma factor
MVAPVAGPKRPASPLRGEVDLATVDRVREELLAYVRASSDDPVVIDCTELDFIGSTGIGMLLGVRRETSKRLSLVNLNERCRRVFEITGMEELLDGAP